MLEEHDERVIRCRRLGHAVTFRYCRTQEGATICGAILDCWWETFDVRSFLEQNLPPEQAEELAGRAAPNKVLTLLELIEKARQDAGGDDGSPTP